MLPFLKTGVLREQGGDPVPGGSRVPVSVWGSRAPRPNDRGRGIEYTGEAPLEYREMLEAPNRSLVVEGVSYRVQTVVPHDNIPHLAMTLSRMTG